MRDYQNSVLMKLARLNLQLEKPPIFQLDEINRDISRIFGDLMALPSADSEAGR